VPGALTAKFATYAAVAILAAAGGAKLVDPSETARVVQFLFDLRAGIAWWLAHPLSVIELTVALCLARPGGGERHCSAWDFCNAQWHFVEKDCPAPQICIWHDSSEPVVGCPGYDTCQNPPP
jgi:hypothetical protein